MTSFRVRPRFRQEFPWSPDIIQQRLQTQLDQPDAPCTGLVVNGFHTHILLKVPPEDRHYWSPQLQLSLEKKEEGTLVRGLYGPAPSVWTLFAFAYSVLSLAILFVGLVGYSQWSLGMDSRILWLLLLFGGLLGGLYLLAQLGQKIGAEQTFVLHHFYEKAVEEKVSLQ